MQPNAHKYVAVDDGEGGGGRRKDAALGTRVHDLTETDWAVSVNIGRSPSARDSVPIASAGCSRAAESAAECQDAKAASSFGLRWTETC